MAGKIANTVLGIIFYVLGVITVTVFTEPTGVNSGFFAYPAVELVVVSVAVFLLSALFYGKYGFLTMFAAGAYMGSGFANHEIYVFLSIMPLLLALMGGSFMGQNALSDLKGKSNFFESAERYMTYLIVIVVLSAVIGFLFGSASLPDISF